MKKLLLTMLLAVLLIPTVAWAEENPELISPAPSEEVTVETTTQPETIPTVEPTTSPVFSIEVFGYTIAISEIDGVTTVALLKENEDGSFENLAVYDFSGPLGRAVSTVARLVAPGPAHGKVVSSFVRAVNEQRREKKREEIHQRKEGIQQRKEERETVRNEWRKEKQEKKELKKGNKDKGQPEGVAEKTKGKGRGRNRNGNLVEDKEDQTSIEGF